MSLPDPEPPPMPLPPLDIRRSLSEAVHHALQEAITDGRLQPGARLREVAIAAQLHVSPTPVREALRKLEREGLVEHGSHRGATVAVVSPAMMANLYELHETLEAFAMRTASQRGPLDLGPTRALLAELDQSLARPDQTTFNRLDLRFHRSLNDLGGNPEITDLIERTHRRIQAARVHHDIHLPDRPRRSQAQHHALVDALADADADAAEALTREHIGAVRDQVIRLLNQTNVGGQPVRGDDAQKLTPATGTAR